MAEETWTRERDQILLRMRAKGQSYRAIAMRLDVSYVTVHRRHRALVEQGIALVPIGEEPPEYPDSVPVEDQPMPSRLAHQQDRVRKLAAHRRGADVPPHLEKKYFDLLKSGLPIVEALKRLGLSPSQAKRR